jgi:hypothetical protein
MMTEILKYFLMYNCLGLFIYLLFAGYLDIYGVILDRKKALLFAILLVPILTIILPINYVLLPFGNWMEE